MHARMQTRYSTRILTPSRLANQMRRENVDVMGDKPVRNDAGGMSLSEEAKQRAYREETHHLLPGEIK